MRPSFGGKDSKGWTSSGAKTTKDAPAFRRGEPSLPVIGEKPPKICVFLKDDICSIYGSRPTDCKDYPLEFPSQIEGDVVVRIKVSSDCKRGEKIAKMIQNNPPKWLKERVQWKPYDVELLSFYEEKIKRYLGEE